MEQLHGPPAFRVAAALAAIMGIDAMREIIRDACVESPVIAPDDVDLPAFHGSVHVYFVSPSP